MKTRAGRGVSAAMAVLFAFAALVQLNDPDPVRWFAIYAAACAASIVAATGRRLPSVPFALVSVIALVWAAAIVAGGPRADDYGRMFEAWEMRSVPIEEAREASGLLIVGAWMAVLAGFRRE
jgi:hypothetical protein